ncbi:MAG: hypothetical protein KDA97_09800, partial [Acidimicrobiales bacterium]|nr:hypothetical protein [Acidimicrobiales bacterium]
LARAAADQQAATLEVIDADRARAELAARAGTAGQAVADAEGVRVAAVAVLADAQVALEGAEAREVLLELELEAARDRLRRIAADQFAVVPTAQFDVLGSIDDISASDRRSSLANRGIEIASDEVDVATVPWRDARDERRGRQDERDEAADAVAAASEALAVAVDERDRSDELLREADGRADAARARLTAATEATRDAIAERRTLRLGADAVAVDVPLVALHAYWRASSLAPCAVPWWLIAGIGRVESGHGSSGGSQLEPNGDTAPPIIGIALDGRPGTQAIADTDGGRFDQDPTWDRAVGPMQFIPGTWGRWAVDGNADGDASPHNLYDAALAAADYLCYSRGDLDTEARQREALSAYNRSTPYANKVLAEGRRYRDALDLPDVAPRP